MVIDLFYGLGNQMFIYAFGEYCKYIKGMNIIYNLAGFRNSNTTRIKRKLAIQEFPNVKIDVEKSIFAPNFHLTHNIKNFICKKIYFLTKGYQVKYSHKMYELDQEFVNSLTDSDYIIGYFQTDEYIKPIEKVIRKDFEFGHQMTNKVKAIHKQIEDMPSIAIHIRRGDYVLNDNYGTLGINYYNKAINFIVEKLKLSDICFFVFSDDISWAQENLIALKNYRHVYIQGNSAIDDLRLMSKCKHQIIANSTFSWWGAWLNGYQDKIVISPSKNIWFGNKEMCKHITKLIPQNWVCIE